MGGPRSPAVGSTIVRAGRAAAATILTAAATLPVLTGAVVVAGVAAGCGPDGSAERPFEPTLPAVDDRAVLLLEVGDDGVRASPGERPDPAVRTDPPTAPAGSVVEVRNTGAGDRRFRAGTTVDTGILRPGESTLVVLAGPIAAEPELALVDAVGGGEVARLHVAPAD